MTSLAPFFYQQFFDINGNPLAGGFIWTYAAGTSTPQATYIDSTGSTPNANPIVLDSAGRASIWLGPLAYKFVVEDSTSAVLGTIDNVSYINPGSITGAMIANGAVGSAQIADDGVETVNIADQAVTAAKIADGTITNVQIAPATILGSNIAADTITSANIAPGSISAFNNFVTFWTFTIAAANATVGATYSDPDGSIFTVLSTISGGTSLQCSANGSPTAGVTTLTKLTGTGDASIAVTSSTQAGTYSWIIPVNAKILSIMGAGAGGGGGGGQGSSGGTNTAGSGGNGCSPKSFFLSTQGLTNLTVIIGAGGVGGISEGNGSPGSLSSVGPFTFYGALGGLAGNTTLGGGQPNTTKFNDVIQILGGVTGQANTSQGSAGQNSTQGLGGLAGNTTSSNAGGGGGGAGIGAGGQGADGGSGNATTGGISAGGGGGSTPGEGGGNGGPGYIGINY